MVEISPKERTFRILRGEKVDRIPATSLAGCGGTVNVEMQEATGIYWPDAHKDPEKMAKLAIASYELTGLENVRVPFDFVEEPEALGCKIKFGEKVDSVPAVVEHVFNTPEDLKMPNNILELGRIPVVLKAIEILKERVGDFLPISSLALGPFTLAAMLAGEARFLTWVLKKPDYVRAFVDFATEFIIEYAKAQYKAGSHIVQIGDPTASPDLISPDAFRQFAKPALIEVADNLDGLKLLHICGKAEAIVPDMAECGYHGISIEESVNIAKIKPLVGNVKILGNINSKRTLLFGKPEDVEAEVKVAIASGVDFVEPGCGFAPRTPTRNIKAMVEATKKYGAKT